MKTWTEYEKSFSEQQGSPKSWASIYLLTSSLHKRFLRHFPQVFEHIRRREAPGFPPHLASRDIKLRGKAEIRPSIFHNKPFPVLEKANKYIETQGDCAEWIWYEIDWIKAV